MKMSTMSTWGRLGRAVVLVGFSAAALFPVLAQDDPVDVAEDVVDDVLVVEEDVVVAEKASPISVSAETVWGNKYLFRGVPFTDDFTMFPAISASAFGLSLNYWGAVDVSGETDYVENDYYVTYDFSPFTNVGTSVGYIYYDLPTPDAGETSTQELYLGLTYDTGSPLSPYIDAYYDFDVINGTYVAVGTGYGWEYGSMVGREGLTLDLSAALGISFEYTNPDDNSNGLNDILLGATLPFPLNDYAWIQGTAQYSIALDELDDAGYDDEFFFGAGVGLEY